jgi:hypothetical protein
MIFRNIVNSSIRPRSNLWHWSVDHLELPDCQRPQVFVQQEYQSRRPGCQEHSAHRFQLYIIFSTFENEHLCSLHCLVQLFSSFCLGAIQKIRVKFSDHFRPPPPCVNLCHFAIPPFNKYVLKSMTPPHFDLIISLKF